MNRLGCDAFDMSAPELGRRRVREVRESSGRLPPRAKYWFPSEGIVAASAFRLLRAEEGKEKEERRDNEGERKEEDKKVC